MKEFIRFLMYDPKYGKEKVSDKMLTVKIGLSVLMILFCVAVMSLSAFGFFTHNMSAETQPIRAASYQLEARSDEGLLPDETGAYLLDNTTGTNERIFVFELSKEADSTASVGYGKLVITTDRPNDATSDGAYYFYTQPIGTYLEDGVETIVEKRTVYIRVAPLRSATVSFVAQWGSTGEEVLEDRKWAYPLFTDLTVEELEALNPTASIGVDEEPEEKEQNDLQSEASSQPEKEGVSQENPPQTEETPPIEEEPQADDLQTEQENPLQTPDSAVGDSTEPETDESTEPEDIELEAEVETE